MKSNDCSAELIDQSAIAHDINLKVTTEENLISLSKDGVEYGIFKANEPTYEKTIAAVSSRFVDLELNRSKVIVDFLVSKQALSIYLNGKVYRTKTLLPCLPLSL